MDVDQYVKLWNQASIKILDIRHLVMRTGEQVKGYRLPASGFIYTARGSARVALDGNSYEVNKLQVLHGGKGIGLDISGVEDCFEYYMIYYRASLPLPRSRELQVLLEQQLPFHIQYAFVPQYPITLYNYVTSLDQMWRQADALSKFQVKTLFYQFVHELLRQLDVQGIPTIKPNMVAQAIRYLNERYAEPIMVDGLAELLDCSAGHLSRMFKKETGSSLIEYLTRIRINKARELLLHTDASLQTIAESVGIPDAMYFNRIFKKYVGISPGRFKTNYVYLPSDQYNATGKSESSIVRRTFRRYIHNGDNHYQYKQKGDSRIPMKPKQSITLLLMLSLTLLLSACSGTSNTTAASGNGQSSNAAQQTNSEQATQSPSTQEKVIKHAWGETVIKGEPKNIISLFPAATDYLLALGIVPQAASSNEEGSDQFPTYLADRLQGQKNLGWQVEPNFESILALEPDLIIGQDFMGEAFANLNKIAPTLFAEKVKDEQGIIRMKTSLLKLGDMLGRTEQANQVIAEYEKLAAESKEKIKQAIGDETVMFLRLSDKEVRYYSKRNYEVLYDDLGLQAPASIPGPAESMQVISLEKLPSINPDHIFLLSSDPAETTEMQKTVVWKSLKAVQNNHVYLVDYGLWFQGPGGPIGQTKIIAETVEFLTQ
ncbi:iron complex transport system substrate-binding protein [Paenibacillus algorifonticola]|uniref:Iron complex transport system substrate-binding protein n=1 Tax=Paenibacillus algorifonticola TaxID=684063 RepID=A0A1I2HN42_9BACL|nr:ABC transporter substrate-binding protein [Paenibacillus algorifonticola]SFF31745.1 iron complex transport system substrate-binding protein [Paenibacillus algorifonticola]